MGIYGKASALSKVSPYLPIIPPITLSPYLPYSLISLSPLCPYPPISLTPYPPLSPYLSPLFPYLPYPPISLIDLIP